MPRFVVVEGPNRGTIYPLLPGKNAIGRDPKAQVALPDRLVSRSHGSITVEEDESATVEDHGSRNATFINGVRLTGPHRVTPGDDLRIGETLLMYASDEFVDDDEEETARSALEETGKIEEPRFARGGLTPIPPAVLNLGRSGARRTQTLVGESAAIRKVSELVARCASIDSTVLITGESGTGKELVAEALHRLGPRRDEPFVVLNCANLEPQLLESDLFGHERGAYTGAIARKVGKLEIVRNGTLFLDEIGEMPPDAQAKLLRAIDKRTFQRLGGADTLTTRARFVFATHRDLPERVRAGRFREDFLFRIRVVEIHIPPLRERRDDIAPLALHFLTDLRDRIQTPARGFTPEALARLEAYRFPGNVRELRNMVERCLIFCEREMIEVDDLAVEVRATAPLVEPAAQLPTVHDIDEGAITGEYAIPVLTPAPSQPASNGDGPIRPMAELEREHVRRALMATGWNKSRAAQLLEIDRNTLHAMVKRHNLAP